MLQQWTALLLTPFHHTALWTHRLVMCVSGSCLTAMRADLGRVQSLIRCLLDHRSQLSVLSMPSRQSSMILGP